MKKAALILALILIILYACNDKGVDELNPDRDDSLARIDTTQNNTDSLP